MLCMYFFAGCVKNILGECVQPLVRGKVKTMLPSTSNNNGMYTQVVFKNTDYLKGSDCVIEIKNTFSVFF